MSIRDAKFVHISHESQSLVWKSRCLVGKLIFCFLRSVIGSTCIRQVQAVEIKVAKELIAKSAPNLDTLCPSIDDLENHTVSRGTSLQPYITEVPPRASNLTIS